MSSESTVCNGTKTVSIQPDYQLIETMRWEPVSGIIRFDLHLARLEASAHALGFQFNRQKIEQKLQQSAIGNSPLRLRLTLAPDGIADITAAPFEPLPPQTIWRIAIAQTRLHRADALLRYKTTRRQAYISAREEYSSFEIDEVIMLNDQDEVCEGTITSVFIENSEGTYITPTLSCGLLDGVLRRELLNKGSAREGIITLTDLQHSDNILVGNSLRGLIHAQLIMN